MSKKELCSEAYRQKDRPQIICAVMIRKKEKKRDCPNVWRCPQDMLLYNTSYHRSCPMKAGNMKYNVTEPAPEPEPTASEPAAPVVNSAGSMRYNVVDPPAEKAENPDCAAKKSKGRRKSEAYEPIYQSIYESEDSDA